MTSTVRFFCYIAEWLLKGQRIKAGTARNAVPEEKTSSPVSRVLSSTIIPLGSVSPQTSSSLPESSAGHTVGLLFGLAPSGVYHRRGLLPATRCALTAPFHPYRPADAGVGGFLSAALSVGSRRPGVTWHSALWSPDFPPSRTQRHGTAIVQRTHDKINGESPLLQENRPQSPRSCRAFW